MSFTVINCLYYTQLKYVDKPGRESRGWLWSSCWYEVMLPSIRLGIWYVVRVGRSENWPSPEGSFLEGWEWHSRAANTGIKLTLQKSSNLSSRCCGLSMFRINSMIQMRKWRFPYCVLLLKCAAVQNSPVSLNTLWRKQKRDDQIADIQLLKVFDYDSKKE